MEQPTNTPIPASRPVAAKRTALFLAVGVATIGLTVASQPIAGVILVAAALLVDTLAAHNRATETELAQVEFLCRHWQFMAEYQRGRVQEVESRIERLLARCTDAEGGQ